ncbi:MULTISPECIES: hypothetical protein [Crateriforma]|uniref:Uncharacterized protein n=1 Tax=Crateriforma conspicua TaxID=2527996 RepID=A0A5C6FK54_9PLAN|nr:MULTISPECIES: hypothetical protein [Crateriforma]TWU60968.1 hypothetical protein V7x_52790 [Crateriforma conspicua]
MSVPDTPLNPYAVSNVEDADQIGQHLAVPDDGSFDPQVVSTTGVLLGSIGATTTAGALFGALLAMVTIGFALVRNDPGELAIIVVYGMIAIVIGGLIACLGSLPAMLCCWGLTRPLRSTVGRWTAASIRAQYIGTGTLAGWLSLTVLSGFEGWFAVVSLVPAVVGAVVTGILGERKLRRIRTIHQRLAGQNGTTGPLPVLDPTESAAATDGNPLTGG